MLEKITMRNILIAAVFISLLLASTSPNAQAEPQKYIKVPVKKKPADKDWTPRDTRTIDLLPGFKPDSTAPTLSEYGARLDRKDIATGFFYPRKIAGRWWLIDPQGYPFINVGLCSVNMGRSSFSREPALAKFGTPEKWAEFANNLLADNGFNGTGGWTDTQLLQSAAKPPVYTLSSSFMGSFGNSRKLTFEEPGHLGYPNRCIPVFHPDFEKFCNDYAAQLATTKDDPRLLGHFSDNELPLIPDMLDRSLNLDANNPNLRYGCEAAKRWLVARKGRSATPGDITDADRRDFLEYAFERYLRITTNAIRKYDPNHLCLGPRLHGAALGYPHIFRAAGKYLDVIAVNYYAAWTPDPQRMAMWAAQSSKPFIITEFYAKGQDSGLPNNSGAGWLVPTQLDRARFYQNFTLGLLQSKACVGWHWFKFRDNDPQDTTTDPSNRDSNKGVIDYQYKPYVELLTKMAELNTNVYALIDYFDGK
ncbi:MAG: hypothetical protein JXN61_10775 [Sedimentisphaerales bacterium]|nr:hypothetical protein [Sedimentisphaerales bacterium]